MSQAEGFDAPFCFHHPIMLGVVINGSYHHHHKLRMEQCTADYVDIAN